MIIAFFAPMRSGKSTAAWLLMEHVQPALIVNFSQPLKQIGTQIGFDCYKNKDLVDPVLLQSPRIFMRGLGDYLRFACPPTANGMSYMTLATQRRIDDLLSDGNNVIVDDLRYPDEYAMLRSKRAIFVRVERDSVVRDLSHGSERASVTFDADFVLPNHGDVAQLKEEVKCLATKLEQRARQDTRPAEISTV